MAARLLSPARCRVAGAAGRRWLKRETALPEHARVVVVGGGIIGTSITYHLAKLGQDVVQARAPPLP